MRTANVDDQMDTIIGGVVHDLVLDEVLEPPRFPGLHVHLLIADAEEDSRGTLQHVVEALPVLRVNRGIRMWKDPSAGADLVHHPPPEPRALDLAHQREDQR